MSENEAGAVYTAAIYNHKLFLGTNQGLYSRPVNALSDPFVLVPETQAQVWDCRVIDNRLFVNHNKGTFEIDGENVRFIPGSGGVSIVENPLKPNSLVQSTYSNLVFYKKENSQWKTDRVIYRFNDLIRYIEIDHFGNYWASHMYRSVFRLRFDENDSLVYNKYYGEQVFGKDNNNHAFKVENRIVFTTGEKLYTFDDLNDTITEYAVMNENWAISREQPE